MCRGCVAYYVCVCIYFQSTLYCSSTWKPPEFLSIKGGVRSDRLNEAATPCLPHSLYNPLSHALRRINWGRGRCGGQTRRPVLVVPPPLCLSLLFWRCTGRGVYEINFGENGAEYFILKFNTNSIRNGKIVLLDRLDIYWIGYAKL